MVLQSGYDPLLTAYQAAVLPLNYKSIAGKGGIDPPSIYVKVALPLSYFPIV